MTVQAYLTIGILLIVFILLIRSKIPAPAIFLGALTCAITFDLAPLDDLLKGFKNPGMLTVGVLFIVAAGMYSTGAITMIMDKIIGLPKRLITAQLKILPPISIGSAFLNNTPLVAMMIPVIQDLARTSRLPQKHLLIPLSFASILGGTCTLIGTSTNLVIGGLVIDAIQNGGEHLPEMRAIGIFDPAWVGVPIAVACILFMIVFGHFLLPKDDEPEEEQSRKRLFRAEFEVHAASRLTGRTIEESGLNGIPGCTVLSVKRSASSYRLTIEEGDVVTFSVTRDALLELWRSNLLIPHIRLTDMTTKRHTHQLVLVVISRNNRAVGRRISDLPLGRQGYEYKIVAISRDGKAIRNPLEEHHLRAGDTVVLEVNDSFFYDARTDEDFALSKALDGYHVQRTDRAVEASIITVLMVAVVALGWMSMLNAGLLASGAMLLTGCLDISKVQRNIDWGTLIVIACAIGLESAVTESGLATRLSTFLTSLGGSNPHLALAVIFMGCTFMTNIITNNAAAAFMFPIALSTAYQLGVSFMPFAITLMIANSCAFITPTGYQTNLMVWGPGNYSFMDFVKIGIPMTLIVGVMTLLLTPMMFPF